MKCRLFTLLLGTFVLFSCKKDEKTYTGATMIEFTETSITETVSYAQKGFDTLWVKVQLVGATQTTDVEVVVDAYNGDASAVSNQLIAENAKAVIKAGGVSTEVPILINADNISESKTVYLKLSEASTLKVSENYKQLSLQLKKQSFTEFFTGSYTCVEPEYQDATYKTVFYSSTVDSSIYTKNFLNYAVSGLNTSFTLSKVSSKQLIIQGQTYTDEENKLFWLSGRGSYDLSGNMKVEYILWDYNTRTKKEFVGSVIYTKVK